MSRRNRRDPNRTRRRTEATHLSTVPAPPSDADLSGEPALADGPPDLMSGIAMALEGGPLPMLETVAQLWFALDGGDSDDGGVTLEAMLGAFMDTPRLETSAVLAVGAAVSADAAFVAEVRQELLRRQHKLPAWLRGLEFDVYRAAQMPDERGEDFILGVRLPGGREFTVIVYVDHLFGTIVKDSFGIPEKFTPAVARMREVMAEQGDMEDSSITDIDVADAAARIRQALDRTTPDSPTSFSDSRWPGNRRLIEWIVDAMPAGGAPYELREILPADLDALLGFGRYDPRVAAVGSVEALETLDADPLPDEPFDTARLPADIRGRVEEVRELCDRFADTFGDLEFRTAVRRLLSDAAAGDPAIFRRRGAARTAAAAVCWLVARANDLVGPYHDMTVGELAAEFGMTGSPAQRAEAFQRAIGIDPHDVVGNERVLGSPRYLTSYTREALMEEPEIGGAFW